MDLQIEGVGQLAVLADVDKRVSNKPVIGPWTLLSMDDLRTPVVAWIGVRAGQKLQITSRDARCRAEGHRAGL